jgi:hypothetical protein
VRTCGAHAGEHGKHGGEERDEAHS